jgi:hypothetical protein
MDPKISPREEPIIWCSKGLKTGIVNFSVFIYKTTYNANRYNWAEDLFVASMDDVRMICPQVAKSSCDGMSHLEPLLQYFERPERSPSWPYTANQESSH